MSGLRDYQEWHHQYDDPASGLSLRLDAVRRVVAGELDRRVGPVRVLSACAGDGRDVLGVLAGRADAGRVHATFVEILPPLAEQAAAAATAAGVDADVRIADAGSTDSYVGAVPADVVLLVGIFGNISAADIENTARLASGFCAPGATLLWSRGVRDSDLVPDIRRWFAEAGFVERDLITMPAPDGVTRYLGVVLYDGPPAALEPGRRLFTFTR